MPMQWMRRSSMLLAIAGAIFACAVPAAAQKTGGLSGQLDEAEKKLDSDIKACRPINVNDYFRLQSQASANVRTAEKAQKAGLPIDVSQVVADAERATGLLERAQNAANKPCPPPNQQPAQTASPPTRPPPPPPVEPPTSGVTGTGQGTSDLIGELESQADDAVAAYWSAYDRCDRDGMKKALDKLRQIAEQVHEIHETATAAGKFGRFSHNDIEDMIDLEEDIDDFVDDSRFDIPKCPPPQQSRAQTGPNCPASLPGTPQESLLRQPLKIDFGYVPRLSSTRYSSEILDYHNSLRMEFGSPPLTWNPGLAANAASWAKTMTETGQLQHSPRTGRENERENLSLSLHGANSLQTMLDTWGMERRNYRPGIFPAVSANGDWMKVAHYSQIVWPTTTQVGCGFYAGARYDALVCRYAPPGNTDGKPLIPSNPCWPRVALPPPPPPPP
jgi:hypothetical protein